MVGGGMEAKEYRRTLGPKAEVGATQHTISGVLSRLQTGGPRMSHQSDIPIALPPFLCQPRAFWGLWPAQKR
jgi:hypothetical protein